MRKTALVLVLCLLAQCLFGLAAADEPVVDETAVVTEEAAAPEAPAEEAPAPEAPAQEAPAPEAPAQEAPAPEAPAQEAPAPEAPKQEAPAEETPKQEAPAQEAPKQEAPAEEAPKQEAPAEEAPEQEAPAEEAPAEEAPKQEAPAEEAPKQEEPAQEEPVQEEPAEEAPAQEEPVKEEEPAQEEPAEEAPVQEAPAQEEPVKEEEPAAEAEEPALPRLAALKAKTEVFRNAACTEAEFELDEAGYVVVTEEAEAAAAIRYAVQTTGDEIVIRQGYVRLADVKYLTDEEAAKWENARHEQAKAFAGFTLEPVLTEEKAAEEPEAAAEEPEAAAEEPAAEEADPEIAALEAAGMLGGEAAGEVEANLVEREARRSSPGDYVLDKTTQYIIEYKGTQTHITLPTEVGGQAVKGLAETAFARNTSIVSVTIPAAIADIERGSFQGCTALKSVSMQNAITTIKAEAFKGCTSLEVVSWPSGLTTIDHDAFSGCTALTGIALPVSLKTLGDNAFANCSSMTYADMPKGLTTIGSGAFSNCRSMREIVIPNTVTSIGNAAFENCAAATVLKFTATPVLTEIKNFTFKGCAGITDVVIPDTVTAIGREAFCNCAKLETVDIPSGVTNIGVDAFTGASDNVMLFVYNKTCALSTNALGEKGVAFGYIDSTTDKYAAGKPNQTFIALDVRDFVDRCYSKLLGRTGDRAGILHWTRLLAFRGMTGGEVVANFTHTSEFKNKHYTNTQIVTKLYETMLNRTPDAGMATWTDLLNDLVSPDYIITRFCKTPEFTKLCKKYNIEAGSVAVTEPRDMDIEITRFIIRCYEEALNRTRSTIDIEGLNFWCNAMWTKTLKARQIADNFVFSAECLKKHPTDGEFVEVVYGVYLGRASDPPGKATWVAHLAAGKTKQWVADSFARSGEFQKLLKNHGWE